MKKNTHGTCTYTHVAADFTTFLIKLTQFVYLFISFNSRSCISPTPYGRKPGKKTIILQRPGGPAKIVSTRLKPQLISIDENCGTEINSYDGVAVHKNLV